MTKEEILLDAIENIANPIAYMQRELEEGYELNATAAIQMADDANYLKEIARKTLRKYDATV